MRVLRSYMPFFIAALLMSAVLLLIYPHYQYYIDPDGTSYLTIAARYAAGDWTTAINGYWSPFSCWLTAGLMHISGLPAIPASVIINALGAAGCLYISQSFFLRCAIVRSLQWMMNSSLSLFLCYAIFWQSFADLWECFFLLCSLRIILSFNFLSKAYLWVALGFLGAFAYFAKAYSFPFFILNTLCCVYYLTKGNRGLWLRISVVSIGVMLLSAFPWVLALHSKYGIWTTSTAGPLNTSWYLVGHPYYKAELGGILPPPYAGSPYYWEDPYLVNGDTPHFWSSWQLFGRQWLKIIQNLYKLVVSLLQLSVIFPLAALIAILVVFSQKVRASFSSEVHIVALSFLLFPLGYLLVNFEARYLWYMLPLGMLIGAAALQQATGKKLLYVASMATILLYPAWCMYRMYDVGKVEYALAQELKQRNIRGSFTGIFAPGLVSQGAARLAYFSGNALYYIPVPLPAPQHFTAQAKRDRINYYVIYSFPGKGVSPAPYNINRLNTKWTNVGELNELTIFELNK